MSKSVSSGLSLQETVNLFLDHSLGYFGKDFLRDLLERLLNLPANHFFHGGIDGKRLHLRGVVESGWRRWRNGRIPGIRGIEFKRGVAEISQSRIRLEPFHRRIKSRIHRFDCWWRARLLARIFHAP